MEKVTVEVDIALLKNQRHELVEVAKNYAQNSLIAPNLDGIINMIDSMLDNSSDNPDRHTYYLTDWKETHFKVVEAITLELEHAFKGNYENQITKIRAQGMGAVWERAEELTDEFERMYENKAWDGEWLDTITKFLDDRLK